MRAHVAAIAVSVRVAAASSAALSTRGAALTSVVAVPMLHVLVLTAVAATLGASDLAVTTYAGVLATLGAWITLRIVGQIARDRLSDVLVEVLLTRPLAFTYWAGKAAVPVALGSATALAAFGAVFALDPARATTLCVALATAPVIIGGAVLVGVGVSLASVLVRDPYSLGNIVGAILPLTSGVVAPLAAYPPIADVVARAFPFANAIDAFRHGAATGSLDAGLLLVEGIVCLAWFGFGVACAGVASRRVRDGAAVSLAW